jgi:hypothetical protein
MKVPREGIHMQSNAIFFGWNRPLSGREGHSAEHFQQFVQYLGGLQQKGTIKSFTPVFLQPHGGDMNGFFLITGDGDKLETLQKSNEWMEHIVRAGHHLDGFGCTHAYANEAVGEMMALWTKHIPR